MSGYKPSWHSAPSWAQYLVRDGFGRWWWHEVMPYRDGERWAADWVDGFINHRGRSERADNDWTTSLEKRP